jgi:hypothetical protein
MSCPLRAIYNGITCAVGQPLVSFVFASESRGKSGLHRAACRLTAGGVRLKRTLRKVPQKIYRLPFAASKGEKGR